ncbi:MAG TPA: ATP-binding protein, partial [Thermodesulfobacteriota bacterium]|nr:ATP-binding protein [Thermodesulfobacteriota bacterium]
TISWFCREYEKVYSSIRIDWESQVEETEIPAHLKTVIYRILQEAMNNAAKYSRSNRVSLYLRRKKPGIELMVEDYGSGFDPEQIFSGELEARGFGLTSMRERAELAGGSFSIESERGRGTRVRAVWKVEGSA